MDYLIVIAAFTMVGFYPVLIGRALAQKIKLTTGVIEHEGSTVVVLLNVYGCSPLAPDERRTAAASFRL